MQKLLAGHLSEYSLAEILNFIQEGNKTGVLYIEPKYNLANAAKFAEEVALDIPCYYLSFQGGRIMSIFHGLEHEKQDLVTTIAQKQWITPEQTIELRKKLNELSLPWGLHLKILDVISAERIKLLFTNQVTSVIPKIFEIHQGKFKFDQAVELNYSEMTGLSLHAREAVLIGLRSLKDWSGLTNKLPDPKSGLQRFSAEPRGLKLERNEESVWQLALGKLSIYEMAPQLNLPVEEIRQIGFRLRSIGLVHEVASEVVSPPSIDMSQPVYVGAGNANVPVVSTSFLSNLMGFLKKKKG
jgi:Domain of unknown function (DUF4388)